MSLATLFMSFLFGGLAQLLPLHLSARKVLVIGIFAVQASLLFKLVAAGEIEVLTVGGWPHYAGISWIADGLSLVFAGILIFLFPASYFALLQKHPDDRLLQALLHFFAASAIGAFFTADLFNLFVMFEILLLSSYTFFARAQWLRAGKLYIWTNILASCLFLIVVAYVYKSLGTVNLADIGIRLSALETEQRDFIFWSMALVFLLKAGFWPLYLWMPSSYPSLHPSLLAFFGVLSSKVGLYAFVRWTGVLGWGSLTEWQSEFQILCAATLIIPAAAAFTAKSLRASLAYWTVSHIGLSVLSLSLAQPLGLSGLLIYFVQDVAVTAGLFYFCAAHEEAGNPRRMLSHSPFAAVIFILLALSASGFPLTSGFWPKIVFLQASLTSPFAFGLILFSALLFLGLSVSLWNRYFVGPAESPPGAKRIRLQWQTYYCLGISFICIFLGTYFREDFQRLGAQASQSQVYIEALMQASQRLDAHPKFVKEAAK